MSVKDGIGTRQAAQTETMTSSVCTLKAAADWEGGVALVMAAGT